MCEALTAIDRLDDAREACEEAVAIARRVESPVLLAKALVSRIALAERCGRRDSTDRDARELTQLRQSYRMAV
jgi:hypothetical protein